jgi:hypothetical protein
MILTSAPAEGPSMDSKSDIAPVSVVGLGLGLFDCIRCIACGDTRTVIGLPEAPVTSFVI